ncbi:beta strand repeat-containing protein [Roseateles sp. LYH14W]|uniref:Beta strand repeat-containing protein n=1 Tax=Pelomonas parva TaxID=3299032 RepID=A0ABW7F4D7_9BURK
MSHRHPALRALPAALALISLLPAPGGAAVHLWTGTASANWSDAANWVDGLPPAGSETELVLDSAARAATFNDIAGGFALRGLTLGANAPAPTLGGQALRFQGEGAFLRLQSDGGHGRVQADLVLDSTLQVAGGPSLTSQLFLQGGISGSGGLALLSGRVVLSGANSYTGTTTIAAGATVGAAGTSLGSHTAVQVAAGAELQLVGAGGSGTRVGAPLQLAGLLSSSARKVSNFLGQPVSGASVEGPVTLAGNARVLAFGASGAGLQATELIVSGAVQRAGHALTLQTGGANNLLRVSGDITGNGDLLLKPAGGQIVVGTVAGDGAVRATGAGGGVSLGAVSGDGAFDVAFDEGHFGQVTSTGAISGARPLRVSGGTLNLGSQAHSFVGTVQMTGSGQVTATHESHLGAAANTLLFDQGGVLELTGSASLSRAVLTTGGMGTVLVAGNTTGTISSVISGSGGIAFANFGVRSGLTLTATNTFEGGLAIGSGILMLFDRDANLGAAGGGITLGGILALPGGFTLDRPLEVSGASASLSAAAAGTHRLTGPITGNGTLNLGGNNAASVFVLAGSASHSGGVKLASATLELDSDARLGAATGVLDLGRANGLRNLPATLRATADLSIAATRSTSFRDMTVDTNGFDVVFNQPINGLGMIKAGAGTWTLNTANPNTSGDNHVNVQQGTLALGVDEALGRRSTVEVAADARLALGGHALSVTTLNSAAGSVVDLGTGGTLRPLFGTLDGELTGQGSLVVGRAGFSAGAVTLNGANGFTGTVEVMHGSRLTLGHAQALGAAGNLILLDNGALEVTNRLAAPLVITAATQLQIGTGGAGFVANGQSIIVESAMTGSAPLRIQGGSMPGDGGDKFDVRLAHRANSFTGDLVLGDPQGFGSAVLGITADGSLGAAGNRLILGKSFYDGESTRSAQGGLRAWDSLTLGPTRSVLLDGESDSRAGFIDTNGHTVVVAGAIDELASGLGLLKTGAGTLVLNGQQGYSGDTVVDAGTLGGHGEVQRLAVQAATLAPGESAGLFGVRGDLSFSGGALLDMELGGLARGSGYDALDVGGSVDLGGDTVLRLSFIGGFTALAGQQFQLINAGGGLFGEFANVADGGRLLTVDGAGSFIVHYGDGQGLVLSDFSAAAVPEPGSWALLLAGAGLLAWRRRRAE